MIIAKIGVQKYSHKVRWLYRLSFSADSQMGVSGNKRFKRFAYQFWKAKIFHGAILHNEIPPVLGETYSTSKRKTQTDSIGFKPSTCKGMSFCTEVCERLYQRGATAMITN